MDEQACWAAVLARDATQDGRFVYGVLTTGVYCRPSCSSRRPLRKNARFYATPAQAQSQSLRPCKRCRPLETRHPDPMAAKVDKLSRYIAGHACEPLTLERMGRIVHASPFHLQRSFKAIIGVTPKDYLEACRLRALKTGLRQSINVTDAIYAAGFGSVSRVYERANTRLGMTPRQYRAGGAGVEISYATSSTPLGLLMMAATDRGLCFVQFGENSDAMRQQLALEYPQAALSEMPGAGRGSFRLWMQALTGYLRTFSGTVDLPVDVAGTVFQMKVWNCLQRIPVGELRSYTEVAQAIGRPKAVRAVARACATNRVAVVIPCHRVIRGDGDLAGYRWGLERKRTLIERERVVARRSAG